MKFLPLLLLICAACAAQDRALPSNSCPIAVSVAGTDVPLQSGNHIVVWFTNQTSKRVARTQFKLFILDSFGYRYPASEMYYSAWETAPGAGGVIVRPAKE